MDDIKKIIARRAAERGIQYLVHFTRQENLPSITTYGLRSRQELNNLSVPFTFNDSHRLDGLLNSISLSITFPNYKMFYSYRMQNRSASWAVILLDTIEVLGNLDCAFQYHNAACREIRSTPIESRKTLKAFEYMFFDGNNRKTFDLKDNETTNPQAEVLCFDSIPSKFFKGVILPTTKGVAENYFAPRRDYSYWKSTYYDEFDF